MTELARQIEEWLLAQDKWVSGPDLCARFNVHDDRAFRCSGNEPGLISEFTISHTRKGYRHIRRASTVEWIAFKVGLLRHAFTVIRRVRRLGRKRHSVLLPTTPMTEKDTGQLRFL